MKVKYRGSWLTLNVTGDGYEFVSENRGNVSVAVLPYHDLENGDRFYLARYEICPAHGDQEETICALTGTVEAGDSLLETAMREVYEESGYTALSSSFMYLGEVFPSKSSNHRIAQFSVDIAYLDEGDLEMSHSGPGDGSPLEMGAYCIWHKYEDLLHSKDPILHSMAAKIRHR